MATTVDTAWSSSDLARQVCDVLVADGRLKEKPAFIRADREKKICGVFEAARLDGSMMATMTGRAVEVAVRNATQGEAWVDDVQRVLKGMMSEEQAAKTDGVAESDEMKLLREKMVENAKVEFPDGKAPENPAGPGGPANISSGSGRECFSCGELGHQSRDCPNRRSGGSGLFFGGGGGRECYNCGQIGHQSRDCPQPRQGGFGGGGRECYNCGQLGHQARDCPEKRQNGYSGGGNYDSREFSGGRDREYGGGRGDAYYGGDGDRRERVSGGGNTGSDHPDLTPDDFPDLNFGKKTSGRWGE